MPRLFFAITLFLTITAVTAQEIYEVAYWDYGNRRIIKRTTKGASTLEMYNAEKLLTETRKENNPDTGYTHERTVYTYNNRKQKTLETEYSFLNKIIRQKHFEYDETGRLVTMWYNYRNKVFDSLENRERYFYDASGKLVKQVRTYGIMYKTKDSMPIRPTTETSVFAYEEKDGLKTVTERMNSSNSKKTEKTVRVYNEHGHLVSITENKKKLRNTYEYDAAGEWTVRRTCTQDGILSPWICDGEYRRTRIR